MTHICVLVTHLFNFIRYEENLVVVSSVVESKELLENLHLKIKENKFGISAVVSLDTKSADSNLSIT